jgi:hypothetical protein
MAFSKAVFLEYTEYLRLKSCETRLHKILDEKASHRGEGGKVPNTQGEEAAEELEGEGAATGAVTAVPLEGSGPVQIPLARPVEAPNPYPQPPPEIPVLHKVQQPDFSEEVRQDNTWHVRPSCSAGQVVNVGEGGAASNSQVFGEHPPRPWYFLGRHFDSDEEN